jgi:hypothetical protein
MRQQGVRKAGATQTYRGRGTIHILIAPDRDANGAVRQGRNIPVRRAEEASPTHLNPSTTSMLPSELMCQVCSGTRT